MRSQISARTTGRGSAEPTAWPAACPRSAPDGIGAERWQLGQALSAEEFVRVFGDAIDDRIAEILDERDTLRLRSRLSPGLAAIALLLAVAATIVLRHEEVAVSAVWLSTAAVCLAARTTRAGRR
jgi:hypothetical protein